MRSRVFFAAASIGAVLAAVGCAGREVRTGGDSASPREATSAMVSGALVLRGTPIQLASALGSVWVLTCERNCSGTARNGSGQLIRVDAGTGRIVQRIDVVDPTAFAIGGGAIWLTHFNQGSVSRVDLRTGHTTETVSLSLPTPIVDGDRRFLPVDIGAAEDAVWVSTARGWLAQIDPRSSRVVALVRAPLDATGRVAVGLGAAWVAESSLGVGVVRAGTRRLRLLWIKSGDGAVAVDQLAVGGGRVWAYGVIAAGASPKGGGVLTNEARLVALDPRTQRIIDQLPFPAGPYEIAYGRGALFAANYQSGRLYRIDSEYRIHALPPIRGRGILVTVTHGAIWAATKSGLLRRIVFPTRAAATVLPGAIFSQGPYMGVACHIANSVACDRVGLAVWLRRPAVAVSATIAGAPLKLNDPQWSGPVRDGRRTMFAGFLQPAGFTTRLHVTPEPKTRVWLGDNAPTPLVRFRIDYGHGQTVLTQTNVWLSAGWG